jgi:hypothetical protein
MLEAIKWNERRMQKVSGALRPPRTPRTKPRPTTAGKPLIPVPGKLETNMWSTLRAERLHPGSFFTDRLWANNHSRKASLSGFPAPGVTGLMSLPVILIGKYPGLAKLDFLSQDVKSSLPKLPIIDIFSIHGMTLSQA